MTPPSNDAPDQWADYLDPQSADPELPAAEQASLNRVATRLRDDATWAVPPAALRERLLAAVAEESAAFEPTAAHAAAEPPTAVTRRGAPRWLMVASAAAVLTFAVVLVWPRSHPQTFSVQGTAIASKASAIVELEPKAAGVAIRLTITGLQPAPQGTFYAAWLRGTAGVVPVGTFHWRKGGIPIDLWSGVSPDRYPELFVTLQREGAPPTPSDQVVLTGSVT